LWRNKSHLVKKGGGGKGGFGPGKLNEEKLRRKERLKAQKKVEGKKDRHEGEMKKVWGETQNREKGAEGGRGGARGREKKAQRLMRGREGV